MPDRTCSRCGGPIRSKRNTSGFCHSNPECKREAQKAANRRYHEAHPEKRAEYWAQYSPSYAARRAELDAARWKDPETRAKRVATYDRWRLNPANAERMREHNRNGRLRYLARLDRPCKLCTVFAVAGSKFCREHARSENRRQYRARRSGLLARLADRQEMLCPWCGEWLPENMALVQVDHIIPRASGLVIDEEWNYQALHRLCNLTKTDQITPEAIELAAQHGLVLTSC